MRRAGALLTLLLLPLAAAPGAAATLSGIVFEDLDLDGVLDPGEVPLEGVAVRVYGRADGGGTESRDTMTGASGTWLVDIPEGCYVVEVTTPADARLGPVRTDCPGTNPEPFPVGQRRVSSGAHVLDALAADNFSHYALGDSIAAGVSFCIFDDTNYHDDVHQDRVQCVAPSATLNNNAVGGHTTSHLLRDPAVAGDGNTALDAVNAAPDLVSVSIGGNDFLDVDPGPGTEPGNQDDTDTLAACASRAMVAMRANMQEILSTLVAGLPDSDVEINTVYDNLGFACGGDATDFHNRWVPLGNELIRSTAWGQERRVTVAEVWPDYAHLDVQGQNCCGLEDLICTTDLIHPDREGRQVHENRFWESFGGILLGNRDPNGILSQSIDTGVLPLLEVRRATLTRDETDGGATEAARVLDGPNDQGAVVPVSGGSFYVEGFDAAPGDIQLVRAVVGVRYRGTGTYEDDLYWIEASYDPTFPPHGETLTTWDTRVPLVGGAEESWSLNTSGAWTCNTLERPNGTRVLLDPEATQWRRVTAMLTKNLEEPDPTSGLYQWPPVTFADLSTLSVRVRSRAVGTPDDFRIEWDDVWVDLYGTRVQVPVDQPLTAVGTGSLNAGDPFSCDQPRLDPTGDACTQCVEQNPDLWRIADGGLNQQGEGLRFYELPGRACTPAGDDEVFCVDRITGTDLELSVRPAGAGCP